MAALIGRAISGLTRFGIVALLVAMLPVSLLVLAASGPTLSDPNASGRVGSIILSYLGLDLLVLICLVKLHSRCWAWLVAGTIALAPIATFLTNAWVQKAL